MPDEDFHRGKPQKPIHIENGFEFTLEVDVAGVAHGVAQVANG